MVYGILGLINFAHGEVVMVGAMVALTVSKLLLAAGLPPLLVLLIALLVAAAVCMMLGYGIERIAYRPLRNAPRLAPLITAIGVSIVLQNLAMIFWGREYHAFPQLLPNTISHGRRRGNQRCTTRHCAGGIDDDGRLDVAGAPYPSWTSDARCGGKSVRGHPNGRGH
ncbi:MAG: hypothetical protein WDM70_03865 [Nitrosomonadales bacterium]